MLPWTRFFFLLLKFSCFYKTFFSSTRTHLIYKPGSKRYLPIFIAVLAIISFPMSLQECFSNLCQKYWKSAAWKWNITIEKEDSAKFAAVFTVYQYFTVDTRVVFVFLSILRRTGYQYYDFRIYRRYTKL